jgi:hypothetical protein
LVPGTACAADQPLIDHGDHGDRGVGVVVVVVGWLCVEMCIVDASIFVRHL